MTLPYGTMTDEEMKAMPLAQLQKDGGLLFLWVTGRAVRAPGDNYFEVSTLMPKITRIDRVGQRMSKSVGVSICYLSYRLLSFVQTS